MARNEVAAEIVERGREALIRALGPAGALLYMQELLKDSTEEGSDGAERVSFGFGLNEDERRVVVRFNRSVTWLKLTPEAARTTAKNLSELADQLEASGG